VQESLFHYRRLCEVGLSEDVGPSTDRGEPDAMGNLIRKCVQCGLLNQAAGRDMCLNCLLRIRGLTDDDEAPGIGDS
jgi:hypothetical protein